MVVAVYLRWYKNMSSTNKCPNCGAGINDRLNLKGDLVVYLCGSYGPKSGDRVTSLTYETDYCTTRGGLAEAWAIINVLNLCELDRGEAYPRATLWLHEWEHLRKH